MGLCRFTAQPHNIAMYITLFSSGKNTAILPPSPHARKMSAECTQSGEGQIS